MHTSKLTAAEKDLNSKLFYAVEQNNLDKVKELIRMGLIFMLEKLVVKKLYTLLLRKGTKIS